jgi:hypothetical protein
MDNWEITKLCAVPNMIKSTAYPGPYLLGRSLDANSCQTIEIIIVRFD